MAETNASLVQLEQAERMLAAIASVDDAKALMDFAEMARVYARQNHLGTSAINHATAIKLRAEMRLADVVDEGQARGEIASAPDTLRRGGSDTNPRYSGSEQRGATLPELGISAPRLNEARLLRDEIGPDAVANVVEEANKADVVLSHTALVTQARHSRQETAREHDAAAMAQMAEHRAKTNPFEAIADADIKYMAEWAKVHARLGGNVGDLLAFDLGRVRFLADDNARAAIAAGVSLLRTYIERMEGGNEKEE